MDFKFRVFRHVPVTVKQRGHVPLRERNSIYALFRKVDARARCMIMYKHDSCHVETCVLLVRDQKEDVDTVSIKVDLDGLNIRPENRCRQEGLD